MARPCKDRKIDEKLKFTCFKPVGIEKNNIKKVSLEPCEIQAIKLSNLDNLSQVKSAEFMEISASTFNRILKSGQGKIADALINGKAIQIIK